MTHILKRKIFLLCSAPVAHTCNPSYLGGWDRQDRNLRTAQANSSGDLPPISKITRAKWAGDVVQAVEWWLCKLEPSVQIQVPLNKKPFSLPIIWAMVFSYSATIFLNKKKRIYYEKRIFKQWKLEKCCPQQTHQHTMTNLHNQFICFAPPFFCFSYII
jgi:hypothetical protein